MLTTFLEILVGLAAAAAMTGLLMLYWYAVYLFLSGLW